MVAKNANEAMVVSMVGLAESAFSGCLPLVAVKMFSNLMYFFQDFFFKFCTFNAICTLISNFLISAAHLTKQKNSEIHVSMQCNTLIFYFTNSRLYNYNVCMQYLYRGLAFDNEFVFAVKTSN
jgi:hypothetical protein